VYVVTATVTLSDDEVVRNRATDYGGGIYNAGRLALDHSTVSDNATDNDCPVCFVGGCPHGGGGGIDNRGTLTLDHSIVCGNATSRGCLVFMGSYSGGDGGGILNNGALTLIDSTVSDNVTGDGGVAGGYPSRGGDGGHGGGICNRGTLELVNSTVGSNTTGQGGAGSGDFESFAGDGGDGGGIYSSATLMVVNSTLSSNTTGMGGPPNGFSTGGDGGDGGGLYLFDGNTTLLGSTVSANVAHDEGGGLYLWSSDATLDGNTIVSNTAAWGGGLYLSRGGTALTNNVVGDNRASIAGSGLYIRSSSPRLLHTTIARNVGGDGTGISVHGAYSTVALTNTILVSHTVGITVAAGNTATLDTTLWGNGVWANGEDWGGAGTIITGSRNYWGDPALVNPDAGDYHLGPGSAAIDRGVETEIDIDIDGDLRPIGPAPDVGADEAWIWVYLPVTMRNH
jgi:parallel beta-helix repeat protein